MSKLNFLEFLDHHSIEETIEVLDEVLSILVINTEYQGLSDQLVHQYLLVKGLREVFFKAKY